MADVITREYARGLLPERPREGHKGTFGHVFVVAGSRGFTGGAVLACRAAGRSGAGLVTLGIPWALADAVTPMLVETMSLPLPGTEAGAFSGAAVDPALTFAEGKDGVVLGPGLSQGEETRAFVKGFAGACPAPLLIDADGLNCLGGSLEVLKGRPAGTVLTPHPGEMGRLTGLTAKAVQEDREGVAAAFARGHGCVVVLKGAGTIVADGEGRCMVNETGNSGLGTGGTGDVLSGLIGGLLAQGLGAFEAAALGVHAHGVAGDFAAAAMTERGMVAGDVVEHLGAAWRWIEDVR